MTQEGKRGLTPGSCCGLMRDHLSLNVVIRRDRKTHKSKPKLLCCLSGRSCWGLRWVPLFGKQQDRRFVPLPLATWQANRREGASQNVSSLVRPCPPLLTSQGISVLLFASTDVLISLSPFSIILTTSVSDF